MTEKASLIIEEVLGAEGGYSNDPLDRGGRTYCGISELNFPEWAGWKIINDNEPIKRNRVLNDYMLKLLVEQFYNEQFYSKLRLDEINSLLLSKHIMDHSVNCGRSRGVRLLQESINKYKKCEIDGLIGPKTISLTNEIGDKLLPEYIDLRHKYYDRIVQKNPSQERYIKGWHNRVNNLK